MEIFSTWKKEEDILTFSEKYNVQACNKYLV